MIAAAELDGLPRLICQRVRNAAMEGRTLIWRSQGCYGYACSAVLAGSPTYDIFRTTSRTVWDQMRDPVQQKFALEREALSKTSEGAVDG